MAGGHLNVAPHLRAWTDAGLLHLLRPAAAPPAGEAAWPPPWDGFAAKISPPCAFCITYWELGLDLGGQPDPRRRQFLASLFTELPALKGRTAFWPVAALQEGVLVPDAALFRRGMDYAGASVALCFGRAAFQAVWPGPEPAEGLSMQDGCAVILAPELSAVLALDAPARRRLIRDLLTLIEPLA